MISTPIPADIQQSPSEAVEDVLRGERARAERLLNGVRGGVLVFLAIAALLYAPTMAPALRHVNAIVITPLVLWTVAQHLMYHRRGIAPDWLAIVNPLVDITGVTAILAGYGLSGPELALKTPVFQIYFLILAARPITSATRRAAAVSVLAAVEYFALAAFFMGTGRIQVVTDPLAVLSASGVSPLDQGARLLFLGLAGVVSMYCTAWHERVVRGAIHAQMLHDAEERALSVQLQAADKMSAVGALAASVAHEVASPLTNIGVLADLIQQSATDDQSRKDAKAITDEARRTVAVVRDLLQVARPQREPMGPVSVNVIAERALHLLRLLLRDNSVTVHTSLPETLPEITGDAGRLEQVVLNLIINAVQAMEQVPKPNRLIWFSATQDGDVVRIEIGDNGPGLPPGMAEKCFERFYTTKPAGKGTGLGLWVVRQIVEDHGGRVVAGPRPDGGALFTLALPTPLGRARPEPSGAAVAVRTPQSVAPILPAPA